jgi:hypothetical protein
MAWALVPDHLKKVVAFMAHQPDEHLLVEVDFQKGRYSLMTWVRFEVLVGCSSARITDQLPLALFWRFHARFHLQYYSSFLSCLPRYLLAILQGLTMVGSG